ncbi:DUF6175 family protein [Fibrobacter sp. UWR1]|uniref:DUF6175 family protein n=1 Tax=Fibrobacter sp. UWR1 TaxID=2135645 RepID=UPI000DAF3EAA|nr:DUF6175 family protein [Fibrobacter sp. UWR1]PZW73095.1 hypothetical protein C8E88_10042 [Fibrobacter sp. UWR1]
MMNKILASFALVGGFMLASCADTPKKQDNDAVRERAKTAYAEIKYEEEGVQKADVKDTESAPTIQISNAKFKTIPTVLVAPALTGKMNASIDVVRKNPLAKTAMEVINAYLTNRDYKVVSLESQAQLDEVVDLQSSIAGNDEDLAYVAGLSVGADINITYSGSIQENDIVIDLNASEASTANLLASESVRMKNDGSESQRVLVQKCMQQAIVGLENKVREKLAAQLDQGVQYKVVAHLTGEFTDDQAEEISNMVSSQIRKKFSKMQVISMSRNTYDLMLTVDPAQYEDAQMVYSVFYEDLKDLAKVRKQNITKKLIILEIQ